MAYKIRLPDEDIEPVWDKMDKVEREWYEEFKKATEYYNWKSLQYLCDIAPSDQYDRLFEELNYESHQQERERYTVPKSRFPRYSEHDYSWAPSMREHYPKSSVSKKASETYNARATSKNMKWAK